MQTMASMPAPIPLLMGREKLCCLINKLGATGFSLHQGPFWFCKGANSVLTPRPLRGKPLLGVGLHGRSKVSVRIGVYAHLLDLAATKVF